jgi:hypothetical protein
MANTTGKKFGGRKKGSLNKNTTEIKELINSYLVIWKTSRQIMIYWKPGKSSNFFVIY